MTVVNDKALVLWSTPEHHRTFEVFVYTANSEYVSTTMGRFGVVTGRAVAPALPGLTLIRKDHPDYEDRRRLAKRGRLFWRIQQGSRQDRKMIEGGQVMGLLDEDRPSNARGVSSR